ncbi:MAG: response regulator transcription factor [Chlorobium sp.]|nr:response regulator transcription factor [Chlorobium sp.]
MNKDPQINRNGPPLRIIIVEDQEELRTVLKAVLSRLGHDVRGAGDGAALDLALSEYPADVVVLDLNLPGEDGVSIALRLRQTNKCGIIMTTSRGLANERINGFENGADLYLVKPVDPMELHAALLNLGRRLRVVPDNEHATWSFDPQLSVMRTPLGISVNLTAQENIVMQLLLATPGETVLRPTIFSALGHFDDEYASKRIETLLSRLRSKVRVHDPNTELPIRARHGMGYAFLADLQQQPRIT